jgi:hypothetical protein
MLLTTPRTGDARTRPTAATHTHTHTRTCTPHHHTQTKDDDELLYYLLQLVQALRFEVTDNSRLSRFLIGRAASNPAFATFLHWCACCVLRAA